MTDREPPAIHIPQEVADAEAAEHLETTEEGRHRLKGKGARERRSHAALELFVGVVDAPAERLGAGPAFRLDPAR